MYKVLIINRNFFILKILLNQYLLNLYNINDLITIMHWFFLIKLSSDFK